MTTYKNEQCHLTVHGRNFHFVSYEGQRANERKNEQELPPMWYLMGPARRWPVMPFVPDQAEADLHKELRSWIKTQGLDRPA